MLPAIVDSEGIIPHNQQQVNGSTMTEEAKPDICVTKVTKSGYNGSDIVDSEGLKLSMLKHT